MKYKKEHESFAQRVKNKVYFTNILVSENWKVFNINKKIYIFITIVQLCCYYIKSSYYNIQLQMNTTNIKINNYLFWIYFINMWRYVGLF